MTQDNLVEDVHFRRNWITPYQLGRKAVMVNISDVCASGAKPLYATIGLSMPADTDEKFIKEFFEGACSAGVEIVGGDLTGADKIFISVTAIGSAAGRRISSRANARVGQKVVVSGEHGASAAGLEMLRARHCEEPATKQSHCCYDEIAALPTVARNDEFVRVHLEPIAQCEFSERIAANIKEDYAMMDTSDGLMDALLQIAQSSGNHLSIDFDKVPYDKDLEQFNNYKDLIFYGGEDYQLVATVPEEMAQGLTVIGEVLEGSGVGIKNAQIDEGKFYDHF
jgi:thiamine-monophosphate kinase